MSSDSCFLALPSDQPRQTSIASALQSFVAVLGLDDLLRPDEVPGAIRTLEAELLAVGADAYRAELHGASLAESVRDFERFPSLARLHADAEDIVTLGLRREIRAWATRFLARGVPPAVETMLRSLVAHARRDDNPVRRALGRVLLFEGVRLGLLLRIKLSTEETYGIGMSDEEVDVIAESETLAWMDDTVPWVAELESFEAIGVAGLVHLERHLAELGEAVRTVGDELRETMRQRARFEARLFELDARDAILIRNAFAEEFEVQPLTLDLLRERHPAAFGNVKRGALDTRLSRLRGAAVPTIVRRKDLALIDLLRDQLSGGPGLSGE